MFGKMKSVLSRVKEKVSKRVEERAGEAKEAKVKEVETMSEDLKKPTLKERMKRVVKREVTITEADIEDILDELELELIRNDVAVEVAESIREELKKELVGRRVKGKSEIPKTVEEGLREALLSVLEPEREVDLIETVEKARRDGRPAIIMFVGVNGSGKTTTIAKVAKLLKDRGYSVVIAAADTFRAAAIEQLEEHAERLGVTLIKGERGDDPTAVAFNAVQHAEAKGKDVVLVDTAGRAYTDVNLMEELKKMKRVLEPDLVVFVGDALAGNDAIEQAKTFHEYVGIDCAILTKVDADAKGGAVLSISKVTGAPILYLGVGQDYDDLKAFSSEWFVERVIGGEES
ncbi:MULTISPECIES: signal recognition particle-docking protein FtsY [unclassified Methanopyrus]|uniref:signal recognition particle-docking protein FtsY n=1 Tax=Methanopyrus sp. SNP6 TaxID=1937005 RepID=UPI001F004B80|nr:signal recognition particle-docking protein FtsY [Methanopyrus sp. SNP6]